MMLHFQMEHHDFPYIPGRNLPKVREIAPEFYENLHIHESWITVLKTFVLSPSMGPYHRIKRPASVPQEVYGNYALAIYLKPVSIIFETILKMKTDEFVFQVKQVFQQFLEAIRVIKKSDC